MASYNITPGYWRASKLLKATSLAADTEAALAMMSSITINGIAIVDENPLLYLSASTVTINTGSGFSGDSIGGFTSPGGDEYDTPPLAFFEDE
jgi:hypothetical protein